MEKKIRVFTVIIILVVFVFSCASSSSGGKTPAWVSNPPSETDKEFYFIGAGSDPGGQLALAEQAAAASILGEVTRYLGVRITSDITVEAQATITDFQQRVTENIRQESQAQVSDFTIVDRWVSREAGGVTVYILGRYDRRALEAEKARIQAIFLEQQEASAKLEREAGDLELEGRYYAAVVKYCEAALSAVTSGVENPGIKFERNINKAKAVISRINLIPLNNNLSGNSGEALKEDFKLQVSEGTQGSPQGLSGVPVLVTYKEIRSGRSSVQSSVISTDQEGLVSFALPVPKYVGKEQITMMLDLRSAFEPLEALPREYQDQVDSIKIAAASKRVVFDYTIISRASSIPIGLMMVDVDRSGNPTLRSDTQAGLQESLTAAKFLLQILPQDNSLLNLSDGEIVARFKEQYKQGVKRVIYGFAQIRDFQESSGSYIVRVEGTVKVVDLETGNIIFTDNKIRSSRGGNINSALSAAFKSLGSTLGESLLNNLP